MQEKAEELSSGDITMIIIVTVSTLVAIVCQIRLWRCQASVWRKLFWAVVVFVPFLGPLLYGALFHTPSVQAENDQAPVNQDAFFGGPKT